MSSPAASAPWRSVIFTAFVPAVLNATGRGAIQPIIPVVAVAYGADLAQAGLIAALLLVGGLVGDLPSGVIVARVGERRAMIGAAGVSIFGSLLAALIPHPATLAIGVFIAGCASAIFALARHSFITTWVPVAYRARALSTLGGSFRLGMAVGPFIIAGLLALGAPPVSAFFVLVVASLAGAVVLMVTSDPTERLVITTPTGSQVMVDHAHQNLFATIRKNGRILGTAGVGSAIMSGVRASRQVILPLWAVGIGVDETRASIIIGAAMLIDFALFYASGWLMDRFGRRWVAIPTLTALSIAHIILAVSHDLPARDWWFIAVAMLMALANGFGAGVLMTLGSDLADPRNPAPFLGAWRFVNDSGQMLAPLVISALIAAASLPIASLAMGAVGLAGAVILERSMPRRIPADPVPPTS